MNAWAVVTNLRITLRQERLHKVAISVNTRDIVVSIAVWTYPSAHQLLDENVLSAHEVEDQINVYVVFLEHLSLSHGAGHAVKDKCRIVLMLNFARPFNYFNGHIIIYKVSSAQSVSEIDNEFFLTWPPYCIVFIDNPAEVVAHGKSRKAVLFLDQFSICALSYSGCTKKYKISLSGYASSHTSTY